MGLLQQWSGLPTKCGNQPDDQPAGDVGDLACLYMLALVYAYMPCALGVRHMGRQPELQPMPAAPITFGSQ